MFHWVLNTSLELLNVEDLGKLKNGKITTLIVSHLCIKEFSLMFDELAWQDFHLEQIKVIVRNKCFLVFNFLRDKKFKQLWNFCYGQKSASC